MSVIICKNEECPYYDLEEPDQCVRPLTEIKECPRAVIGYQTSKDLNFYLDALMSAECVCGDPKKPKQSFCYKCFKSLPLDLQRDLYSRMGDGYEQAYDAAVNFLE